MTTLLSGPTFFFKRVFPVLWFGFIAALVAVLILLDATTRVPVAFVAPLGLTILGIVLMMTLLGDLADEVHDGGDHLVVCNGGYEEVIPLTEIVQVRRTTLVNPPRVTLLLERPGRFGNVIVFTPKGGGRINPFAGLPAIDDLVARIERARAAPLPR